MTQRTGCRRRAVSGLDYSGTVDMVEGSPVAFRALRHRIGEDQQRDLPSSVYDAVVLYALQRLRLEALQSEAAKRSGETPLPGKRTSLTMPPDPVELFDSLTYDEAVKFVMADPATHYALRQRIVEDKSRDAVESFRDAEVLWTVQRLRLESVLDQAGGIRRSH